MTPAPARSGRRTHARRATIAPHAPRRVSGPAPRPIGRRMVAVAAGAGTLPRRGNTGLFARVRALPDHRVVDRLLRSRLWIWVLGAALGGIVAMQVSLLKLNSGISRAVTTVTTLERQNAELEGEIARLSSTDRVQSGADALGMLMPPAGQVEYLSPGAQDAQRAVRRMQPPSADAAALLANGGVVPGSLAAPPVDATVAPDPATAGVPAATDPAATATTPAPEPTTTPVVTDPATTTAPDPATTTAPVAPAAGATEPTTTSQAGGAVAPQG